MGEMCINFSDVKAGLRPAVKALNKNKDKKLCKSEVPDLRDEEFETFINIVSKDDAIKVFHGKEIRKDELDILKRFADSSRIVVSSLIRGNRIDVENGHIVSMDLRDYEDNKFYLIMLEYLPKLKHLDIRGAKFIFKETSVRSLKKALPNLKIYE